MTNELPADIAAALEQEAALDGGSASDLEGIVTEMIALREVKDGLEEALKGATAA